MYCPRPSHGAALLFAISVSAAAPPPETLSPDAFARASLFHHQPRRLERALFAFHFAHRGREAGIAELTKFQNTGGGFAASKRTPNPVGSDFERRTVTVSRATVLKTGILWSCRRYPKRGAERV